MFYARSTGGFYDVAIHGNNIPDDAVELTIEEYQALLEGQSAGKAVVPDDQGYPMLQDPAPLTDEQILVLYTDKLMDHLNKFAQLRNYGSILSAATYLSSTNPKFRDEAQYAIKARDDTWAKAYEVIAEVKAGTRSIPSFEELIAEMPKLEWPVSYD